MPAASPERLREDLVSLVHRGGDVREFSLGAASHPATCGALRRGLRAHVRPGDGAAYRRGRRERIAAGGDAADDRDRGRRGGLQQVPGACPGAGVGGHPQRGDRRRARPQRAPPRRPRTTRVRRRAARGAGRRLRHMGRHHAAARTRRPGLHPCRIATPRRAYPAPRRGPAPLRHPWGACNGRAGVDSGHRGPAARRRQHDRAGQRGRGGVVRGAAAGDRRGARRRRPRGRGRPRAPRRRRQGHRGRERPGSDGVRAVAADPRVRAR